MCLLYLCVSRFINYTLSLFQSMFYSFHFSLFFFFFFSLCLLRLSNSLSETNFFVLDTHTIFFFFLILECLAFFYLPSSYPPHPLSLFLWQVFSRFTLLLFSLTFFLSLLSLILSPIMSCVFLTSFIRSLSILPSNKEICFCVKVIFTLYKAPRNTLGRGL